MTQLAYQHPLQPHLRLYRIISPSPDAVSRATVVSVYAQAALVLPTSDKPT